MPPVQHDSENEVREKRSAPDSAQKLPGPSVGVLTFHMIQEETAGEEGDHAEETPSSPLCSGQQLSTEQYRMKTPAKAARGTGRRGPSEKSSPGYLDLCQAPQRSKVVRGDFRQRRCGGACVTYLYTCVYQMLEAPVLGSVAHEPRVHEIQAPVLRSLSE